MALHTAWRQLSRRNAVRLSGAAIAMGLGIGGRDAAGAQAATLVAANTALIRQFFAEAVNHGQVDLVDTMYALTFVDHRAGTGYLTGRAGIIQLITDLHTHFPGIVATVEDLIAEGDQIATRVAWRGTHPPAGTHLVGTTLHLFRISDGTIVDAWSAGWEWLATAMRPATPGSELAVA